MIRTTAPPSTRRHRRKSERTKLPAKYISAATSGLKCTVTEDPSQNVFHVQSRRLNAAREGRPD